MHLDDELAAFLRQRPDPSAAFALGDWCVFRPIVTARSGNVTGDFGIVTARSGNVTAGIWPV